jgi:hypothetical protein
MARAAPASPDLKAFVESLVKRSEKLRSFPHRPKSQDDQP